MGGIRPPKRERGDFVEWMEYESREGCRGGQGNFSWDQVKGEKDRVFYVGNSLKVRDARANMGKDLLWWTDGNNKKKEETSQVDELEAIKQQERAALNQALTKISKPNEKNSIAQTNFIQKNSQSKNLAGVKNSRFDSNDRFSNNRFFYQNDSNDRYQERTDKSREENASYDRLRENRDSERRSHYKSTGHFRESDKRVSEYSEKHYQRSRQQVNETQVYSSAKRSKYSTD